MNYHIVAKGDSLWSIANMHGCSLAELLAANPQISNPNNITLGEKVFLPESCAIQDCASAPGNPLPPPPEELNMGVGINDMSEDCREEMCRELSSLPRPLIYVVKKRDNIYQLAKCFNISMKELLQVNPHIKNPDMIYPGDKIFIPRVRTNLNINSFTGENGGRFCPTCGSKLS